MFKIPFFIYNFVKLSPLVLNSCQFSLFNTLKNVLYGFFEITSQLSSQNYLLV